MRGLRGDFSPRAPAIENRSLFEALSVKRKWFWRYESGLPELNLRKVGGIVAGIYLLYSQDGGREG